MYVRDSGITVAGFYAFRLRIRNTSPMAWCIRDQSRSLESRHQICQLKMVHLMLPCMTLRSERLEYGNITGWMCVSMLWLGRVSCLVSAKGYTSLAALWRHGRSPPRKTQYTCILRTMTRRHQMPAKLLRPLKPMHIYCMNTNDKCCRDLLLKESITWL